MKKDFYKGCVIGLQNKEDVINVLAKIIDFDFFNLKKRNLNLEDEEIEITVLKYFDVFRKSNFYALMFKEMSFLVKEKYYNIEIMGELNVTYFDDKDYYAMTENAKQKISKEIRIEDFNLKNKIIYVENDKYLVVNDVKEVNCDFRIKKKKFVNLSYVEAGVYNSKKSFDKVIKKSISKQVENIINYYWDSTPIQ